MRFLFLLLVILITSCQDFKKQPKCDDPETIKEVVKLWAEMKKEDPYYSYHYGKGTKFSIELEKLINELPNSNVENIITLSTDKELQSCQCQASIILPQVIVEANNESKKKNRINIINVEKPIVYDLLTDSEKNIVIQLYK